MVIQSTSYRTELYVSSDSRPREEGVPLLPKPKTLRSASPRGKHHYRRTYGSANPVFEHQHQCNFDVPAYQVWHPRHRYFRFVLLALLSLLPFGGHFVKNGLSAVQTLMVHDSELDMTHTRYGMLMSALSLPALVVPCFAGRILDQYGESSTLHFLAITVGGQAITSLGLSMKSFYMTVIGALLFGIGEAAVIVGQRAVVSTWFSGRELTFAIGILVAVANVSKMLAKGSTAAVGEYLGGYDAAAWFATAVVTGSFFAGCAFRWLMNAWKREQSRVHAHCSQLHCESGNEVLRRDRSRSNVQDLEESQLCDTNVATVNALGIGFWLAALLHMLFINAFHMFYNISSNYYVERFGYELVGAGIVSSLSSALVVFAPAVGLFVDRVGYRLYLLIAAGLLGILSYFLVGFTGISPIFTMLLMSFCMTFVSTISISIIPLVVDSTVYGTAFGVSEVVDASGRIIGNVFVGHLRDTSGTYESTIIFLMSLLAVCVGVCIMLYSLHGKELNQVVTLARPAEEGEIADDFEEELTTPCAVSIRVARTTSREL